MNPQKKTVKCGICNETGHNRRTCKYLTARPINYFSMCPICMEDKNCMQTACCNQFICKSCNEHPSVLLCPYCRSQIQGKKTNIKLTDEHPIVFESVPDDYVLMESDEEEIIQIEGMSIIAPPYEPEVVNGVWELCNLHFHEQGSLVSYLYWCGTRTRDNSVVFVRTQIIQ